MEFMVILVLIEGCHICKPFHYVILLGKISLISYVFPPNRCIMRLPYLHMQTMPPVVLSRPQICFFSKDLRASPVRFNHT